tara:strand:- start:285 stop:503 length:219 start_codon:yes stop_codon:yes gene_type:complete
MEQCQKRTVFSNDICRKKNRKKKKKLLDSIQNEYCLKRNQFYPEQPSPNLFCNRLEIRMKAYYNNLYSSFKL